MNLHEASEKWSTQSVPELGRSRLDQIVTSHVKATHRQLWFSGMFCIACVVGAILNFYGQFFVNGDPLLVASLRFSVVLVVIPFQWYMWWSLRRKHQERIDSQLDQRKWLEKMVGDLAQEVETPKAWQLALFSLIIVGLTALTKGIEFQLGMDSAAECIGVVAAVIIGIGVVYLGVWHHRKNFLVPRYRWYQSLLHDAEESSDAR